MKLFNKLAFVLALGMIIAMAAPAEKAQAAVNDKTVSYVHSEEYIEVTTTASGKIYYTDSYNTKSPSSTVWYEVKADGSGKAEIDISWIKATADTTIYIKDTTTATPYKVVIAKQENQFGVAFTTQEKVTVGTTGEVTFSTSNSLKDDDFGSIYFYTGKGSTAVHVSDLTKIEWKKGTNGKWKDLQKTASDPTSITLDYTDYLTKGATIYFRVKAVDDTDKNSTYEGKVASKEVKYVISKQANAPVVTINPTTFVISLKSGQEYKISGATEFVKVTGNKDLTDDATKKLRKSNTLYHFTNANSKGAYAYDVNDEFKITVRTAATATKVASKERTITLLKPADITTLDVTSNKLASSYIKEYDKTSGILVTNKTSANLQVAVIEKVDGNLDQTIIGTNTALKWVTVKAATASKDGTGKIPYSSYKNLTNPMVIYRYAPVTENKSTTEIEYRVASESAKLPVVTVESRTLSASTTVVGGTLTDNSNQTYTLVAPVKAEDYTIDIDLATTNVSENGVTPKITTVYANKGGNVVTNGKVTSTGKITVKIPKTAQSSIGQYTIEVEGAKITLNVELQAAKKLNLSLTGGSEIDNGKTKVAVTNMEESDTTLEYVVGDSLVDYVDYNGNKATGSAAVPSGNLVSVTAGEYLTIYEIKDDKIIGFSSVKVTSGQVGSK